MVTVTHELVIEVVNCPNCGTAFGVGQTLLNSLRKNHASFYCPNGHSMSYGETKQEKELAALKKRIAQLKEDSEYWQGKAEANAAAEKAVKNQLKTTRANLTRTRNKLARGMCPCCETTFPNLAEHMNTVHPGYETEAQDNIDAIAS